MSIEVKMGRARGQSIIEYLIILVIVGVAAIIISNSYGLKTKDSPLFEAYKKGAISALEKSNY